MQLVIISILVVVFFGRLSLGTFERLWKMIFFKKLKNFLINEHAKTSNIKKPDIVITEPVRLLLRYSNIFSYIIILLYYSQRGAKTLLRLKIINFNRREKKKIVLDKA